HRGRDPGNPAEHRRRAGARAAARPGHAPALSHPARGSRSMRFDYRPELEAYRAEVRAFIAEHGPGAREHVGVRAPDPARVPAIRAWVAKLYAAGYLGQGWPAEYGGRPGASPEQAFIVAEEIARARTWGEIGAGSLAAGALLSFGTQEQRRHYLPRIRSGTD